MTTVLAPADPTSWTAELVVTDFGAWNPDDRAAAAALISTVNRHRFHAAPRPLLFRARLDTGGWAWMLQFDLGEDCDRLAPGEHLVHVQMPDGTSSWSALPGDMLDAFRAGSQRSPWDGDPR